MDLRLRRSRAAGSRRHWRAVAGGAVRGRVRAGRRGFASALRAGRRGFASVLRTVGVVAAMVARCLLAPVVSVDVDPPFGRERTGRLGPLQLLDVILAAVLYAGTAAGLFAASEPLGASGYPPPILHLLAAACTLPVVLRRRRPIVAWQVAIVGLTVVAVGFPRLLDDLGTVLGGPAIAYVLCTYSVASRSDRDVSVGVLLWSVLGLVLLANGGRVAQPQDPTIMAWAIAAVSLSLLFGFNVRARRRAQADLAAQQLRSEQDQAARAVLEERSRIARELHDVVAHNMSVIAIQAEAAPLRASDDAETLREDLAGIRSAALETLTEMRRILGVLRQPADETATAPAPGLDQIPGLVDNVARAGLDATLTVEGTPRPVAPGVGVSAYRIVQESLSNVLRHAPGAAVAVRVRHRDDPPSVQVFVHNGPPTDPVPAPERAGTRHGLVGMRERVGMLRGTLRAGPTADGGFRVEASLPLDPQ